MPTEKEYTSLDKTSATAVLSSAAARPTDISVATRHSLVGSRAPLPSPSRKLPIESTLRQFMRRRGRSRRNSGNPVFGVARQPPLKPASPLFGAGFSFGAETNILGSFRDPEVTRATYLASESPSQHSVPRITRPVLAKDEGSTPLRCHPGMDQGQEEGSPAA